MRNTRSWSLYCFPKSPRRRGSGRVIRNRFFKTCKAISAGISALPLTPMAPVIEPPVGVNFLVLDSHLRSLPAGVPGGLYLGGAFSEAVPGNALVYRASGFGISEALTCHGLYRFVREDGKIELLGHARDLAGSMGFKSICAWLRLFFFAIPAFRNRLPPFFRSRRRKAARLLCRAQSGPLPTEKDLRALLKGKISDFTLPSHFVTVASLPKDARGEVVPELLPEPVAPQIVRNEKVRWRRFYTSN